MQHDTVNREYFVEAIIDGDADTFLDAISGAIKKRREAINSKKIFLFSPGDIVKFNSQTRPKYLQGVKAEIVRTNEKTLTVKVLPNYKFAAKKYGYGEFRAPVSLVEKVD